MPIGPFPLSSSLVSQDCAKCLMDTARHVHLYTRTCCTWFVCARADEHLCSQANRTAVIRELARLGADLEAKNDAGQVPAQLTKDRLVSDPFLVFLLARAAAFFFVFCACAILPLFLAALFRLHLVALRTRKQVRFLSYNTISPYDSVA